MAIENAILVENQDFDEAIFDFDDLEERLQSQLETEFSNLQFLDSEKEKIGNPDALGKVILDEVWAQFVNQIGLDITDETLTQKYDREHPEHYDQVGKTVMQDSRYKEANKNMKEQQKTGKLKDEYTGKNIKTNESANLDHVVSRKEAYDNPLRKKANLSTEDIVNRPENLRSTNESLNKSKGAKSVNDYVETRAEREKNLKGQIERANKKIDESNISDVEKKLKKEENNKRLQDKLNADDDLMKQADKVARKSINKDIAIGATKEIGKKAGKDALKTMALAALSALLKEIINGLVRFLKSKEKKFKYFLSEMKESIKLFFTKISDLIEVGAKTFIGTVLTEIFSEILSKFKKLGSLIKQGASSVINAIKYLTNDENKNKPFSIKVAQVGKIVTTGLVAGGALFLGEIFENILIPVPGMGIALPLIGTLANVIGMFLASLVSGLIGAIVINQIDKIIAKRQEQEIQAKQVNKGNDILVTQRSIRDVKVKKLGAIKNNVLTTMNERHSQLARIIKDSASDTFDNESEENNYHDGFNEMNNLLDLKNGE